MRLKERELICGRVEIETDGDWNVGRFDGVVH